MELSNLRESGVKKAKLMSLSLQNVSKNQSGLKFSRGYSKSCSRSNDKTKPLLRKGLDSIICQNVGVKRKTRKDVNVVDESSSMRLTRGNLANALSPTIQDENGWQSVFDISCLTDINELFRDLDDVS